MGKGDLRACLRDPAGKHLLFYSERCASLTIDLTGMSTAQPAVAVDTREGYHEIDLGILKPGKHTWQAPHESDWAIAVGNFHIGLTQQ